MARIRDLDGNYVDVPRGDQAGTDLSPLTWDGTTLKPPASNPGAPLVLQAGSAVSGSGAPGGDITVSPGAGDGAAAGGSLGVIAGAGGSSGDGGWAVLNGGGANANAGIAGQVAAQGSYATGEGGGIKINPGDAETGSGQRGGDTLILHSAGDGAGRQGLTILRGLPTADPHVAGALWSNLGIVTVSAG